MAANLRRHLGPAALMGGGLVAVGLAGFVFLAVCGHTLSAADAAAMASFYLIVSIVGTGVFAGLEQETSRSTSAWLATGGRLGVVARRAAAVGLGLLAVVLLVIGAVAPVITDKTLSGQWGLYLAVALAAIASAAISGLRGLLGGRQQFTGYAMSLYGEGLSRIVLCVLLVAVGLASPLVYAMVFVAGIGFAGFAGLPWLRRGARPPVTGNPAPVQQSAASMARALGLLVGATLGFQTLSNLAPILVTARLGSDPATSAAFAYAFVLVRIPILLFVAVQTMLLPALTKAVTNGNLAAVRARLRQISLLLAAVGLPTVIGAAVFGPWATEVLFGAKVRLSHAVLGFLAVSTVLLMATQVLMPALVALGRHRIVTAAWAAGVVVLIALMVLPPVSPVGIAVWAQLVGCGLVVAIMSAGLVSRLRAPSGPDRVGARALVR